MGFWDRLLGGSEDDRRMEHDLREQLAHSLVGMGASVMEAPSLCAVHEWQLGGASPLHILMEEKC